MAKTTLGLEIPSVAAARRALRAMASPERATVLRRFFKTGEGEYAEGDRFLGITVPQVRRLARPYRALPPASLVSFVRSSFHEERLFGLVVWVEQARRSDDAGRAKIARLYLANRAHVNNWDLVDVSAETILGGYLWERDRSLLYRLAASRRLWDRRIGVLATFHFIRKRDFADTLGLAERLLADPEDLMHKAVGWMLREVGKRDVAVLKRFLDRHAARMPRTMLRYAIERLPPPRRERYLAMGRP